MDLQSLPSKTSRKQLRESGFLSLLIHILHEPTIATLDSNHQTIDQFILEFYSPTRVEKRRRCSRLLRSVIECPLPVKEELETLQVLESLRSISECLYGEYSNDSVIGIPSGLASLQELLYRGFYFRDGFNTFERLGGVFVLLDILYLYLDIRFGEWGIVEKSPILEHLEQCDSLRRLTIQLIGRLIYHSTDVQQLFLYNPSLLKVLAENYSDEKNILVRNSIVASFQQLVKYDGVALDCHDCGMVKLLTENAVKCHLAGDRKEELVSNLELFSELTKTDQCQLDFFSVSGSMDMLLDLLNPHQKYSTFILNDHFTKLIDYRFSLAQSLYTQRMNFHCEPHIINRKVLIRKLPGVLLYYLAVIQVFYVRTGSWRQCRKYWPIRGSLLLVYMLFVIWFSFLITPKLGFLLCFVMQALLQMMVYIFFHLMSDYPLVMGSKLAGDIFYNILPNLHDNRASLQLERFRERDACSMLVDFLNYGWPSIAPYMKDVALEAIEQFSTQQDSHVIERERLSELGVCQALQRLMMWTRKADRSLIESLLAGLKRLARE